MARSWSIPIGRLFGVEIRVHLTFVFLLAFVWMAESAMKGNSSPGRVLALVGVIFGCVVLHELGHALAARREGMQAKAIVLLPIGGQACQLQLVDIHLDATTASLDPTRFNGQIRIITSTPRPETCVCQAWFEYQASLSNSQSICP